MDFNYKKKILVLYFIELAKIKWKNRYEIAFLIWKYLKEQIWKDQVFKYIYNNILNGDRIDFFIRDLSRMKRDKKLK